MQLSTFEPLVVHTAIAERDGLVIAAPAQRSLGARPGHAQVREEGRGDGLGGARLHPSRGGGATHVLGERLALVHAEADLGELRVHLGSSAKAEAMMQAADKNGDGRISMKEFESVLKALP